MYLDHIGLKKRVILSDVNRALVNLCIGALKATLPV